MQANYVDHDLCTNHTTVCICDGSNLCKTPVVSGVCVTNHSHYICMHVCINHEWHRHTLAECMMKRDTSLEQLQSCTVMYDCINVATNTFEIAQ